MPDDLARIERDLDDLAVRIRALEHIEAPMLSSALREFRELQAEVRRIQEEGAIETRGQLARIKDRLGQFSKDIAELEAAMKDKVSAADLKEVTDQLKELASDRKALVRIALAAVVAALLSLAVTLILRATGTG